MVSAGVQLVYEEAPAIAEPEIGQELRRKQMKGTATKLMSAIGRRNTSEVFDAVRTRKGEGLPVKSLRAIVIATVAVLALVLIVRAAPAVQAAGLRNCTEITDAKFAGAGCWEDVWAGGTEYRMTFATGCFTQFKGNVPSDLDKFYVVAPQDDTPQSLNAAFRHDHIVRDIPAHNGGDFNTRLRGIFVLCSQAGITSGACVFEMNTPQQGLTLPFAKTVNGQALTSVEPLEAAVDAGLLTLLDTGAVIVGSINQTRSTP